MNKFYLWCDDTTNVENAAAFESDSERASGFQAGSPARAIKVNSALRQANLIACALTSILIPDNDTLDLQSSRADLTTAMSTALTNIIKAVKVNNAGHADSADEVLSSFLLDAVYPIGSIYISVNSSTSPASSFGGTWELLPSGYSLWTHQGNIDYESAGYGSTYRMNLPGIPNIAGKFYVGGDGMYSSNVSRVGGAVRATGYSAVSGEKGGGGGDDNRVIFNASQGECGTDSIVGSSSATTYGGGISHQPNYVNNVYGKSETVQPPAYRVYAWKRIA